MILHALHAILFIYYIKKLILLKNLGDGISNTNCLSCLSSGSTAYYISALKKCVATCPSPGYYTSSYDC